MTKRASTSKTSRIAGVDEVGRGPLAGDVVAAAVILPDGFDLPGLTDSKKLTERRREKLFDEIREIAVTYAISRASVAEIDRINILHASLLAMKRAVEALTPPPEFVYVDGNRLPDWHFSAEAVVQGDSKVPSISAASILAKVTRDREMLALHEQFPDYGFAQHKGYPTKSHLNALQKHGPCPMHRTSYGPVKSLLMQPTLFDLQE